MSDLDERALTSWQIGELLNNYDDPKKVLPILATAIHIWCEDNGEDVTLTALKLAEIILKAYGEGGNENDL